MWPAVVASKWGVILRVSQPVCVCVIDARATARFQGASACIVSPALQRLRVVQPDGVLSTVLGDLRGYREGPAPLGAANPALLSSPTGLFVSGNALYFADQGNNRVRVFDRSNAVTSSLVGRGVNFRDGPLADATFSDPQGIAVGPNGDIYVSGEWKDQCAMASAAQA